MLWPRPNPPSLAGRHLPIERNLRQMMQFFALARPNAAIEFRDGLQLVSSGLDFSPFNSAMLTEPIEDLTGTVLTSRLDIAAHFFAARRERWSFWLCRDLLPPVVLRRVGGFLLARGLRPTSEPPGMFLDTPLAPPSRPLPVHELDIERVRDTRTRLDFSATTACNFDLPMSICREIYQAERSWSGSMHGWVAYWNGQPVATCAAVPTSDCIGLYTIGTVPMFRHKGYAEILMRHVLKEFSAETGITPSILQSTPAGYPMYHKMGYRQATQFSIYLSEH
ncbi:MAG: GNAT family N-acetyltransferase [Acidobacteria bacterium]|nr:GNAT family N-acetyltransferase [Acidobacteriota bacterium]